MAALQAAVKTMTADIETPVSAYLKLCGDRPDSFLLESAEPHDHIGIFSIIAFEPLLSLELLPDRVLTRGFGNDREALPAEFFDLVREAQQASFFPGLPGLPAVGSLMGFIGYEAVRLIENLGPLRDAGGPSARLVQPACYAVFDHRNRVLHLAALGRDRERAEARLARMESRLAEPVRLPESGGELSILPPDRARYLKMVEQAREYIRAGDAFQIVLADGFRGRTTVHSFDVYRRLRIKSPSPYMFYLNFGDLRLAGASPETLVKVENGRIRVRPIAGTRKRSHDPDKDLAMEKELIESEKERAEHLMLVDLGRNDVGRAAVYGSVKVEPFMSLERYSHVMHLVSEVEGRLRPDLDCVDALKAGFPAGTVSGAPKVRAMEIIDELESGPRGPYAGAVGYFGPGGDMDSCIAIRLIVFKNDEFAVQVGAGIVFDSIPEQEYKEIENKAAQSLAALRAAAGGEL